MSTLFKPIKLGPVEIQNRFIHSATYEGMALPTGEVTDETVKRYRNLAKGEVGPIIPGYMYIQRKVDAVSCVSCNKCLAAAANNIPVRCYNKG